MIAPELAPALAGPELMPEYNPPPCDKRKLLLSLVHSVEIASVMSLVVLSLKVATA